MAESSDEKSLVPKYLQEDLSQECKELISTLPTENGWITNHLHQYEEFWLSTNSVQGVLSCQKHFKPLDTDTLLVTFPKSGTTWLKAWTFALLNRNRYPPNAHNHHPLLTTNPHDLVFMLERLYDEKDTLPNLNSISPPRIFATHMPHSLLPKYVKESRCKVVYLCRDPKDTFVSLWHFTNKLRPQSRGTLSLEDSFEKFCRGVTRFGPIWDHVIGYWKESLERPEKVMFLRFEEMKMQPVFYLKKLAQFLGCPFSEEEESAGVINDILNLCSFENLSNLEVNKTGKLLLGAETKAFFRRGKVGDSENLLSIEMAERLNNITKNKLGELGLRF